MADVQQKLNGMIYTKQGRDGYEITGCWVVTPPSGSGFFETLSRLMRGQKAEVTPMFKEYALNCRRLDLTEVAVVDLSPLRHFANLESLVICDYKPVGFLDTVGALRCLKKLHLNGLHISDISPLENLRMLEDLNIGGNSIVDISPLASLTKLRVLNIGANRLTDLSPLRGLNELEKLDVAANFNLRDLGPIEGKTKLKWLNLYLIKNTVAEFEQVLRSLTSLEELDVRDTAIVNKEQVAFLPPNCEIYFD